MVTPRASNSTRRAHALQIGNEVGLVEVRETSIVPFEFRPAATDDTTSRPKKRGHRTTVATVVMQRRVHVRPSERWAFDLIPGVHR